MSRYLQIGFLIPIVAWLISYVKNDPILFQIISFYVGIILVGGAGFFAGMLPGKMRKESRKNDPSDEEQQQRQKLSKAMFSLGAPSFLAALISFYYLKP